MAWILVAFSCGFLAGLFCRDRLLWKLCEDQQKRGDYWCDKYMSLVRDDWVPYTEDFHEGS